MTIKADRNGPCYCGSGIKYKKCCLLSTNKVILSTSTDIEIIEIVNAMIQKFKPLMRGKRELSGLYNFGCIAWNLACVTDLRVRGQLLEKALDKCLPLGASTTRKPVYEIIEHAIGIKNNSYHHIKRLIVNHQVLRKWYFFGFEVAIAYATNIREDKVEKAVIEAYS